MGLRLERRARCAGLAVGTIGVGLVWRMVPLGLPGFWFKYGGSMLWAAMVYWLVAAAWPEWTPGRVALLAGGIASVVELSRLWHTAEMDAFRMTLAGKLLLGRVFSGWDVVAYWLAIGVVAGMDGWFRRQA